jgi:hypothetical protein
MTIDRIDSGPELCAEVRSSWSVQEARDYGCIRQVVGTYALVSRSCIDKQCESCKWPDSLSVVVLMALLERAGVQIELLVARYLTSRPCREQARPAWCSQGFSAPHCERLARNITDVGQVQVPCRDRRQGASRIEHGRRNMFPSQDFLEGCQTRFLHDCRRVAFQDLD